jgi:autotransporter-associated beta strand protein
VPFPSVRAGIEVGRVLEKLQVIRVSPLKTLRTRIAFLSLAFLLPLAGQVRINEIVASASDRILQRSAGTYPKVGNLTPWQDPGFDDSAWRTGNSPFGFGTFSGVTINTNTGLEMQNRVASLYLRKTFTATAGQAASAAALELSAFYNDGFIAYLNGVEIARRNMGNPAMFAFHDQTAFNANAATAAETIILGAANTRLVAGQNTLCIQVHNKSLTGADAANLLMQASLRISGAETLVQDPTGWRYLPGVAEPSGGVLDYGLLQGFNANFSQVAWAARTFNDSAWPVGAGPVGVEGANPPHYILGTNLHSQTYQITPSIYQRNAFEVTGPEAASSLPLKLTIDYDDGLVIYLNGREIARRNLGTAGLPTAYNATATTGRNATGDNGNPTDRSEVINLAAASSLLTGGDNVLAIQLHRSSLTSSDSIARVTLETTGPGARVLTRPADPVRYFVGTEEPVVDAQEQDDTGALDEPPDSENDWIELYNAGPTAQDLSGWSLTDDADSPRKWSFPADTRIPAGGYLVVLASGLDLGPADGATYPHTNFKLSASGEYLGLIDSTATVVDEIAPGFPPQSLLHSYGRDAAGVFGYLTTATPGAANPPAHLAETVAPPVLSTAGGFHPFTVSLSMASPTPGAEIRYTVNGSEPVSTSSLYAVPISITSNRIIRARAFKTGGVPSSTVTHTYLIGQSAAKRSLPAIVLGGDPALTYYGPNTSGGPTAGEGIFAIKGGTYVNAIWDSGGDTAAFHFPLLRGRASEKPATLEYLPPTGQALRTELGVRVSGSPFSRPRYRLTDSAANRFTPTIATQKPSFNLFFRTEFGERPMDYPFFEGSTVTRFTDIRLRAGKNDISNPWITDELLRRIFINTGQIGSTGAFNTLWINGVFKGYYNLTERLREGFMQEHHGSSESWDVQQVREFSDGDPIHWNKMIAYLRSANLANTGEWLKVHDYLDVDNFIDYLAVNSFAAMWDWPNNNWVAARERSTAGRWRFYMWDAEGAFGVSGGRNTSYNSFTSDLVIADALTTTNRYIPAIYTLLSASPEFRLRFADRVQKHFFNQGALMPSRITPIFTELRNRINPIMQETIGASLNETFHNNWILSDTRRTNYFNQLTARNHWPSVLAPVMQQHGGTISAGFQLGLSHPNGSGTIHYRTDGGDPRAPGGGIDGLTYTGPITLGSNTRVRARVRSDAGVWSPEVVADFIIPPPHPTFLPADSADWTVNANWSTAPAAYPNASSLLVTVPAGPENRNVNLRKPVTIGGIEFPMAESAIRNRVRDQEAGNTLTFANPAGALIEVTGNGIGYVEFENLAGTVISNTTELRVHHSAGDLQYGALRLRAAWSGPGGLTKTGIGIASLTGGGKAYTGPTRILEGVLDVSQLAVPVASSSISVSPGGQLRLTSDSAPGEPRVHTFGGPISLDGDGRGAEIPDDERQGKSGALRYAPGGGENHVLVTNPVTLAGPAKIHVDGPGNRLELAGPFGGPHAMTKTGGGTLVLSGDASAQPQAVTVANGTLSLAGALESPVSLAATAYLSGHGSAGPLSGVGTVALDRTVLRAPSASAARHAFVFGTPGMPDFATPAAAGNAALALDSAPPAGTTLDLFLDLPAPPTAGTVFHGGWITPYAENIAAALDSAVIRVFIADPSGSEAFNRRTWSSFAGWNLTSLAVNTSLGGSFATARMLELRIGDSPPADFDDWRVLHFPNPDELANPAVSGPAADPFGTGIANLLAYALGRAPGDATTPLPRLVGSATAFDFLFPFDSRRDDIVCIVEATSDPGDWSNPVILFDSSIHFPPPAGPDGMISIRDESPPLPRRFYRLRVVRQTP